MIYGSWDINCNRHNFFVILGHFLIFYHPNSPKNEKKHLEISFFKSVPKLMIICYTVPEIWCVRDVTIFHYGLFFALSPPSTAQKIKNLKNMKKTQEISSFYTSTPKICYSWDIVHDGCNCCFSYWAIFCPFNLPLPSSPKNENINKMNRTHGDIIILHKCIKNHDYMLYCSWDMMHDGCNCYFWFWVGQFFALLPP